MPGGGVCAVLDYEVDIMAEYVAEMSIELVTPRATVSPSFRKFVSQILSSTRLPKATILLGMNYLSKRVNSLKAVGPFHPIEGEVWRMLTIALLLGSKFLDDNTFQNRSWSEVSGISVPELNKLEAEWLMGIGWNLYVNIDRSEDYNAWMNNWGQWVGGKKMARTLANRDRLSALVSRIETDSARPRDQAAYTLWHQQQVAEYERLSTMKRSDQSQSAVYRSQDISWNRYSSGPWSRAPLTPPDSGYGTPEYPASTTSGSGQCYGDSFNRAFANDSQTLRLSRQNSSHVSYRQHGRHAPYPRYYNYCHSIWEANLPDCSCINCAGPIGVKNQSYFLPPVAYGQAVPG